MWKWLLFLNGLILATMTAALAAVEPASNAVSDPAVGTTVISQKMTFKNQESQAVFDGAVVLTRGTLVGLFRPDGSVFPQPGNGHRFQETR